MKESRKKKGPNLSLNWIYDFKFCLDAKGSSVKSFSVQNFKTQI